MKLTFLMLPLLTIDYLLFLRREKKRTDWRELVLNLQCMGMRSFFSLYFTLSFFGVLLYFFYTNRIYTFADTSILGNVIAFLVVDHQFYWKHRIAHSVPLLWLEHRVHHSSKEFHGLISYRASYISNSLFFLMISPLAYFGFSPWLIVLHIAISGVLQHINHLGSIGRIPAIEKWIHTPWVHRGHHNPDRAIHNHNFGAALLVWDRLYGSYREVQEEDLKEIGIREDLSFTDKVFITYVPIWKIPKKFPWAKPWVGLETPKREARQPSYSTPLGSSAD